LFFPLGRGKKPEKQEIGVEKIGSLTILSRGQRIVYIEA
jgi:hypothetical protein